ncbi:polynucleotide adenylyltransferase PcnB [Acinetobacter johnsonii]|uniref:Poly(A) polymerase I n=1 Tax=Acinetobacter johnsonii TaxID=40214 RepID=A0AA42QNX6_ACIJO|nr:polynucleotide adenylyltransferase PcnB [Acinetobacter johnsonii]MDH0834922.1 polynucleotide adenylyltransferase PcnB [Acinetobacter johnsonii]MDH0838007.1 polynucleotide adenylyltransferase PcnB [Acinetobacter johnsonii]MDH1364710.1 polynucleotide adenylyltransferase PcnB [Acinetobacter johnsonii]MDH1437402.1 polynucleotide adenylyltransferase PcnB [Acinetobacter johnsonii]MDH1697605.1 polynucleotide adenylyltransferase PcnB [Acinetobacter johnsonii]
MQTLRASKCGLSTAQLPSYILDVIDALTKAGYEAYIVGGGVRDMMLGLNPKDFDAVTNATPSQVKEVFGRRCRIIGRRFELAHVYSGRELVEVATFRAPPKKEVTSAQGMILRDNNWGTIEQDFARRDFSINAMYYQPRKGVVLDFCHAVDDIKNKTLRLLGDAQTRFEEDPVRMLRTLRFSAKLGFSIDQQILDVFTLEMTQLLRDVSPHRLYDESQKLFTMGHLNRVLPMLIDFGIWKQLFADIKPNITPFIERAAKNTDQRIQVGKTINPAFFYAVLLWQPFLERCEFYSSKGVVAAEARAQAGLDVLKRQATRTIIPRFAETFIREVWEMQTRLLNPKAQQIQALSSHARFRAGFDFLLLREKSGDEGTLGMGQWWDAYQLMSTDEKERAISQYNRQRAKSRRSGKASAEEAAIAKTVNHEIEPLVQEQESRSRRARKPKQHAEARTQIGTGAGHSSTEIGADHPILKRKRVQRDLSSVIFGPTQ